MAGSGRFDVGDGTVNAGSNGGSASVGGQDVSVSSDGDVTFGASQEIAPGLDLSLETGTGGDASMGLGAGGSDLWFDFPTSTSPSPTSGLGESASDQPTGTRVSDNVVDPEGNFVFCLEIDHTEIAHFYECSGLKTSTEVFELVEGGMNHRVHKLPGQSRWDNLVFRYGVTNSAYLMEWRDQVLQGNLGPGVRRSGSIVLKNNNMQEVRRYNFVDAWPVAWEGPTFSSRGAEVAVEMVEIAHHGIYVGAGGTTAPTVTDPGIDGVDTPVTTDPEDFFA